MFPTALALACGALAGAHPGSVNVDRATPMDPSPTWQAITGPRPSQPVSVQFCRLEGTIEGNIGFEVWLPVKWNGRLLGAGVGGDAGIFNHGDMSWRIAEGFATVTTDSGHKASNARWMTNAKARVDYEHRAVHLAAGAAKALAARFYSKPVSRSYFEGCSGGGRQALKSMQKYPGDYDGVVAGAPGPYMPLQSVRMMWFALAQKRNPAAALTDDDWSLYEKKVTAQCDMLDGVRDGILENPRRCGFRTETLVCKPGQTSDCMSAPKAGMIKSIAGPLPDERGRPMDSGLEPGVRTRPGPPSPLLRAMWADAVYNNPNWDEDSFQRTADLAKINAVMPELRADSTAITPFIRRGGKALIYQGWGDPSTNAGPTVDYFVRLAAANGGVRRLGSAVRLFMVPGMYHCFGGPGADRFGGMTSPTWPNDPQRDILWALINWVEAGRAPDSLTATKLEGTQPRFTRTICPFPQSARYDGKGPQDSASSFRCAQDPVLAAALKVRKR